MITINIQADTNPMPPNSSASSQEQEDKLPEEIKAAEAKVRVDEKWANRANTASFWLAAIYALVTALIAGSLFWTNLANKNLRASEGFLNSLLMAKLKSDAEHKSEVDAKKVRADARNEEIRIENEGKGRVAKVEAESREKIAGLTAEAEQARAAIATAQATAATANAEAARANQAAERERLTRLELEEAVAPRTLAATNKTIERLSRFKGTPYFVEFAADAEAERTAGQVNFILAQAGWKPLGSGRREGLKDGVFVDTRATDPAERFAPPFTAAGAFTEYLRANGVVSQGAPLTIGDNSEEIPDGAVRIRIGFKPAPYFLYRYAVDELLPEAQREAYRKAMEDMKRRDKEERERLIKEWFLPPLKP